jgi:CRISPR-associated protein Csb2
LERETEIRVLDTSFIEFAEPVAGPLCLGYGCHVGLGLFVPV